MKILLFSLFVAIVYSEEPRSIVFQTGVEGTVGSTFSGGMTYDYENHRIFLTGGTYARGFFQPELSWTRKGLASDGKTSDCFLMTIPLNRTPHEEHFNILVQEPTRMGMFNDEEACGPIHYIDDHQRVFMAGKTSADHYGERDAFGNTIPKDVETLGQVLSTSVEPLAYGAPPILPQHYMYGGRGWFNSFVNHPVALTSDFYHNTTGDFAAKDQFLFVASFTSRYSGGGILPVREDVPEFDQTFPNAIDNVWSITIQRLRLRHSNATNITSIRNEDLHLERDYSSQITTERNLGLQPADLIYWQNRLFLLGSTQSNDPKFGARTYEESDDWDGFLVEISPSTGKITPTSRAVRIQTAYGDDEFVHGTCQYGSSLFVVGQTTGQLERAYVDGGAIMYKIDLNTFNVEWQKILIGEGLEAWDCETSLSGEFIYVTGNARNGGMVSEAFSRGGDDVWVGKFRAADGEQEWIRQIGSDKNETVARSGAIVVDKFDQPIIYGNTMGSIGRVRVEYVEDVTNDIFVLTVGADGEYSPPLPIEFFQVPKSHFVDNEGMDWAFLFYMMLIAVALLLILLAIYASWQKWSLFEDDDASSATADEFSEFKSLKASDPNETSVSHSNVSLTSRSGGFDSSYRDSSDEEFGAGPDIEAQAAAQAPTMDDIHDFLSEPNEPMAAAPVDITFGYTEERPSRSFSDEEKREEESEFDNSVAAAFAVSAAAVAVASKPKPSWPPATSNNQQQVPKAESSLPSWPPKPVENKVDEIPSVTISDKTVAPTIPIPVPAPTPAPVPAQPIIPQSAPAPSRFIDDEIESLDDMLEADEEIMQALGGMEVDTGDDSNNVWEAETQESQEHVEYGQSSDDDDAFAHEQLGVDHESWDGSEELDLDAMNAQLDQMDADIDNLSLEDDFDFRLPPR